tara:strand:- start:571 stop:1788 length:1218 start_codon:yes stop_codon:yes gene_type:complete
MASNLRVDNILPSNGTNIGIGTANGSVTFLGDTDISTTGDVIIAGNLGVGGTITYEDVARVDATGISTFREGFKVGPLTGIALTAYTDGSIRSTGIITASSFVGDGSGLTGAGPTLANGANNRIVTATGANALTGETNLTFDGTHMGIGLADPTPYYADRLVVQMADEDGITLASAAGTLGANENNYIMFASTNSGAGRYDGYVKYSHSAHDLLVQVNEGGGSGKGFTFKNSGNLDIGDGNLKVASGHGIDFSATGDGSGTDSSELLADYEEGTWTPVPSRYSSPQGAINCSMSTQLGRYRKIGKMVQVEFYLSISSVTSQGGNLTYIAGLPYAPVSAYMGTGNLFYNSGLQHDSTSDPTFFVAPHTELSSILYFRNELQAGHGLSTKNWRDGHVTGSVTYQTTA